MKPDTRLFYRTLIALAAPVALQNLVASSLNLVDTIMIGQMGETEVAAVGLANQVTFLLNLFLFGIGSGSAIFTAQYWGSRDMANIRRVLGLGLACGLLIASVFTVLCLPVPTRILNLFSDDARVVSLGAAYLSAVAFGFVLMAVSFLFASVLRSIGQARLPLYISAASLLVNTLLNYGLILGHWGLPALGVRGAAIATVIARSLEISLFFLVIYGRRSILAASPRQLFDLSAAFARRFLKTTVPVILNESLWAVGVTLYIVVYARMGTDVVAAINIAATAERLAMVLFFGIANAAAVMLGHRIGAGELDKSQQEARRFVLLGPLIGIASGLILITAAPLILSFYKVADTVRLSARAILLVYGLVMPVRVFNIINIVGVLRSGGDTRFTLLLDTAGVWLIGVPLAFLGGLVWHLPVEQVVILVVVEEFFKVVLGVWRLRSRKWINRLNVATDGDQGSA